MGRCWGQTFSHRPRLTAADALRPYAADIAEKADAGQLILLTGNAPDVFSAAIESDSADTIEGLGILPGRVRYTMMKRHNSFFLGTFDGMEVVGFKSLFGFHYDAAETEGWFDTVRGVGRTPESKPEGFRRGGLYATALIGPLLIRRRERGKEHPAADGHRGHAGLRGRGLRQLQQTCGGVQGAGQRFPILVSKKHPPVGGCFLSQSFSDSVSSRPTP